MLPALSCALCLLAPPSLPGLPHAGPAFSASEDGQRAAALVGLGAGCAGATALGGLAAGLVAGAVIGGVVVASWVLYELWVFLEKIHFTVIGAPGPRLPALPGLGLTGPGWPGARLRP